MRDREREREWKKKKRELGIKREKKLRLWYETVRLKLCKKEGESVTERERKKKVCVWYIEIQREQICDRLKDRDMRKALLEFKKRYIYKK